MIKYLERHFLLLLPLGIIAICYCFQNVVGVSTLPRELVTRFLMILILSVLVTIVAYFVAPRLQIGLRWPIRFTEKQFNYLAISSILAYVVILLVACLTAKAVPIVAAFGGAGAADLADLRESLFRTRMGGWGTLNYLYVIFNNSIMPIVTVYFFWGLRKGRWLVALIFAIGLTLTLQKGAIFSLSLPLLTFFAMQRRLWISFTIILLTLLVIVFMYVFASGRVGALMNLTEVKDQLFQRGVVANVSDVPPVYNVMGSSSQLALALNRILWIPYVTAIDWLRYQRDHLEGRYVMGRSIRPVAFIFGIDPLYLEREVSSMQWGQNSTGTASSNAIFFVDAWVNFGFFGVVFYSFLFGVVIRLISDSQFPPLIASAIVPIYTACFVSLTAIFFSGGLAIFCVLAVLVGARQNFSHSHREPTLQKW